MAELSGRALKTGEESLEESMIAVRGMNSLEEFCNRMNALLATELEEKSLLRIDFRYWNWKWVSLNWNDMDDTVKLKRLLTGDDDLHWKTEHLSP